MFDFFLRWLPLAWYTFDIKLAGNGFKEKFHPTPSFKIHTRFLQMKIKKILLKIKKSLLNLWECPPLVCSKPPAYYILGIFPGLSTLSIHSEIYYRPCKREGKEKQLKNIICNFTSTKHQVENLMKKIKSHLPWC